MHRQCIYCKSYNIKEITEANRAVFLCEDCKKKSGQAHQIDGRIIIKHGNLGIKHVSIGAFIKRNGKILLAKRRTFPYRFSNIAGHLEYGETPEDAIRREVFEEVGMQVKKVRLLLHEDIVGSRCRAGANIHEWYFFRVECSGEPVINSELEFIGWYLPKELASLDLGFTTRYLFNKLGIISDENNEKRHITK